MKITKFRSQLSAALEQLTVHLRQAQDIFTRLRKSAAGKALLLGYELELCLQGSELRELLERFRRTIVAANPKIGKIGTHFSIVIKQGAAGLRQEWNAFARLTRGAAEKLQKLREELCARENELRGLAARLRKAIVKINGKITKVRTQFSIACEQGGAHLRPAQNAFARLTTVATEAPRILREEVCAGKDELREVLAGLREAALVVNGKITKVRTQLSMASRWVTAPLWQVKDEFAGVVRNIADKPERARQELRARENEMRELLATSLDAIVVTNPEHRFVAANPKALDLFGVSETNIRYFTIDIFIPHCQISDLDWNGSSFIGRQERHGKCKIRRLDGSFRIADFVFVANFVPLLHLCRFYDLHSASIAVFRPASYNALPLSSLSTRSAN